MGDGGGSVVLFLSRIVLFYGDFTGKGLLDFCKKGSLYLLYYHLKLKQKSTSDYVEVDSNSNLCNGKE